jgi:peptidoglycan/LPS O-acetylase OafA/YrhL
LLERQNLTTAVPSDEGSDDYAVGPRPGDLPKHESVSNHLSGADGLRAIACLGVIAHHLSQRLSHSGQAGWIPELQAFLVLGSTGVSVFFVLSGFLLSLPFWRSYLAGGDIPDLAQYALRRAARIVPGYYVAFIVSIAIAHLLHVPTKNFGLRLFSGLTFTSGFHYKTFFPVELDAPLWSISFEVFSYLLMPIFMLGLFSLFRRKSTITAGLLYWFGVLLLTVLLNQLVRTCLTPDPTEMGWSFGLTGGAKAWMPNYNPVGFFGHFSVGIIAAGVTARLNRQSAKIGRFRGLGGFDAIALASLITAGSLLWSQRHEPDFSASWQQQPFFFPYYAALVGTALAVLPFSGPTGRILDNRAFRYTAQVSFGLYIWHYPVIVLANAWSDNFISSGIAEVETWCLVSLALLSASYAVATLSYRLVEKPAIDWAHRRRRRS